MLLLALLPLLSPGLLAADPAPPGTATAVSPTPTMSTPTMSTPTDAVRTASGLLVSADIRAEYLAGFTMFVSIAVENPGDQELTFPDLSARPWLAHFLFAAKGMKQDRANTPPAADGGAVWRVPARGRRTVLLEVPLSATVDAGSWTFGVEIRDPAGTVALPARTIRVAAAAPVAGRFHWDATVAGASGAAMAWLHRAAGGFDLYLMGFKARSPSQVAGQYHLAHLDHAVDPWLSRTRSSDTNSRYVYWMEGAQSIRVLPLEGIYARAARTWALPWPRIELLGQGVTDAAGGLQIPIWVPAPRGENGSIKIVGIDKRGALQIRTVTDLTARPRTATGLDAAGNLLLAVGHSAAVDVYRLDPSWPAEMPAKGTRSLALDPGWRVAALSWDVLPDRADRPGGIALQSLLLQESPRNYRRVHSDLNGRGLLDTGSLPWSLPGALLAQLSTGAGPFYALSQETPAAGGPAALWYAVQGGAPVRLSGTPAPGTLFQDADGIKLRSIGGPGVVQDLLLGPIQP